jgi:nucleotide-binding universal stress UspA family protein
LLVVGSRGRGPLKSSFLGSVSVSVARHAGCPVVVCRPSERAAGFAGVTVGADGTEACLPVIEFAFAQASLRGVPLTVVHAFWDVVTPVVAEGDELHALLSESVAGLREKYPDVHVELQLTRGLVDECLAGVDPTEELLVVGRPDASVWARFVHASSALAVLERARTTVAVIPENPQERNPR